MTLRKEINSKGYLTYLDGNSQLRLTLEIIQEE